MFYGLNTEVCSPMIIDSHVYYMKIDPALQISEVFQIWYFVIHQLHIKCPRMLCKTSAKVVN